MANHRSVSKNVKPKLYHFWSEPAAQRLRLALAYKKIDFDDIAVDYWDDETFMQLEVARRTPILQIDGVTHVDSISVLAHIDELFSGGRPLYQGCINEDAWLAVLDWRHRIDDPLARLTALAKLAYRDIGLDPAATESHKTKTRQRYGVSVEEIANGRYDLYAFIEKQSQLKALSRHLAKQRFYTGIISIADLLITADLYPLQTVEGIALPIDLLYYFRRVEDNCGLSLQAGLITPV